MHILYIRIWEERGRHCRSKQSIKKQRTFLLSFKKSLSQKKKGGGDETTQQTKAIASKRKEKATANNKQRLSKKTNIHNGRHNGKRYIAIRIMKEENL